MLNIRRENPYPNNSYNFSSNLLKSDRYFFLFGKNILTTEGQKTEAYHRERSTGIRWRKKTVFTFIYHARITIAC